MIREEEKLFELHTAHSTYAFQVTETGHLEHLYYGKRIRLTEDARIALSQKNAFAPGNTVNVDSEHPEFTLEDLCLEMSGYGKGDVREPMVELIHGDGSRTSDFRYESFAIKSGKEDFKTLPGSYDETGAVEELCITLMDKQYGQKLELFYWVYEGCDVITRSAKLTNVSEKPVRIERLLSLLLDMQGDDLQMMHFTGAWAREMHLEKTPVSGGKVVNSSVTGTSSNRANPFMILTKARTTQDAGMCLGVNLIYSGNHYEAVESNHHGKTRLVAGMNPQGFSWLLEAGDSFEAPEAVLSISFEGFNGLSKNMHEFVREHIVRGSWKKKERPVLLNSWEAAYFDINEGKLLNLAKAAKEVGMELFVMDDGWFGERNDDKHSLGDWTENTKKLPGGVKGLADKVNALGLDFGIWVEPEMVNVQSKLYENHPEWALEIPGVPHSEGRNQRILDMGNPLVQEYVVQEMSRVFSSANIAYVKWDMNRIVSDVYSQCLPADRQGEVMHRYYIGLYHCMKTLTEQFPDILFEGCSSGGNRFDLGILCYFPQIWASDNTDALCRGEIQEGYSYGYPQSTYSAHVSSCPNHQTLRTTPLETRFHVAAFASLGYECNLCDMKKEDLEAIKVQVELYKEWRSVLQFGQFYRVRGLEEAENMSVLSKEKGNVQEWICVSEDKTRAVGMLLQRLVVPNHTFESFTAKGLNPNASYHFYNRELKYNVKEFGDLVNTVSPVHIRQDSVLHNLVAKFVKMDGEKEDYVIPGDLLMEAGVKLKQGFGATGYNEQVRFFQDFASRIYFMEQV